MVRSGVTCVQLREKHASDEEIISEGKKLNEICRKHHVPLIVNDRPDLAKKIGAAGVHVGLSDMGIEKARELLGEDFIIGGSAHNVEEALQAQKAGADYIGCGAVFGSQTKSDVTTLAEKGTVCNLRGSGDPGCSHRRNHRRKYKRTDWNRH